MNKIIINDQTKITISLIKETGVNGLILKKNDKMNSINLTPDLNELHALNEFILNELPEENLQVNLIVEEIFVNIVNHSNAEYVTVNVEYIKPSLTVEFIDNGIEFNPLLKEDPKAPENIDEAQIGGLGIFLAKQLSDEASYEYLNGENHLKITKKVE